MNQAEYHDHQRNVMHKYANAAVRAIRTGYSEKRYDLKNKLSIQNGPSGNTSLADTQSQQRDNVPFKVYGKNKAA